MGTFLIGELLGHPLSLFFTFENTKADYSWYHKSIRINWPNSEVQINNTYGHEEVSDIIESSTKVKQ